MHLQEFLAVQASLWNFFWYLAACGESGVQLLRGFQYLPCARRLARVILLASESLYMIPGFSFPILDTKVLSHQDPSASLPTMCVSLHVPSL